MHIASNTSQLCPLLAVRQPHPVGPIAPAGHGHIPPDHKVMAYPRKMLTGVTDLQVGVLHDKCAVSPLS